MARTSPWWRRLSAALAALVLTVLTFGPGLDMIVCHDEGSLSAAAAELVPVAVGDDVAPGGHSDDGAGVCIHGHCHHPAPYVPATLLTAEAPSVSEGEHDWLRVTVPTSDLQFELKRPPRA